MSKVRLSARKGLQARLCTPKDERMHIMRTFIGIDRFKVHRMTDDMEFIGNTVAAMHVTG